MKGFEGKLWSWLGKAWEGAMDIAYPKQCISCGGIPEEGGYQNICQICAGRISLIDDPKCNACGYPFFGEAETQLGCPHCEKLSPVYGRGWAAALFRGPVRDLIYSLKYEKGLWALRDLARIGQLAPGLEEFARGAYLVPVPLHPRKRRERGYNQSELLAKALCDRLPVKGMADALLRVVDTESQTRFNRQDRYRNLRNAFSTKSKPVIEARNRYIIVDDVFTTGSTLNACAATLRKAGARHVDVLALGHG